MTTPGKIKSVAELLGDRYTAEYKAAFPDVLPSYFPFGYLALLQLRMPKSKAGSILLPDDEKDSERYRVQAALVRSLGQACFKDRQTGANWVEGPWYGPGDFIRCPMYGGDRFNVKFAPNPDKPLIQDTVTFVFIKDADAIALVTGDPLNVTTS
jgi:hypothetical protein